MISFIVAMDTNRVIGKDNDLPWKLPADLAYFKKVTMGNPILMGRKTHESIGRPLPGRDNIIITRNENYEAEGCIVVHSTEEIKKLEQERSDEIFVIGGAEIFKETLPIADKLYITLIHEEFDGDTFFPEIDMKQWKLISSEKGIVDEKNIHEHEFLIYERKS
ncbi:dihydrofolate reductase [Bacillus sp. FJAT-45350]|uniref:dihydrofolate reductase n=1 Tax=Bacillus sp. FJAT-45350 TaxID=2011014 RepID=UPI000BB842F5|nr:dihydrofolate reductase [Bacillus sp. FJAT-45350]